MSGERSAEEQLLWDVFGKMPAHMLIGSACSCGDWSAQCGNDVPEQWRQHVNAEWSRVPSTSEGERT